MSDGPVKPKVPAPEPMVSLETDDSDSDDAEWDNHSSTVLDPNIHERAQQLDRYNRPTLEAPPAKKDLSAAIGGDDRYHRPTLEAPPATRDLLDARNETADVHVISDEVISEEEYLPPSQMGLAQILSRQATPVWHELGPESEAAEITSPGDGPSVADVAKAAASRVPPASGPERFASPPNETAGSARSSGPETKTRHDGTEPPFATASAIATPVADQAAFVRAQNLGNAPTARPIEQTSAIPSVAPVMAAPLPPAAPVVAPPIAPPPATVPSAAPALGSSALSTVEPSQHVPPNRQTTAKIAAKRTPWLPAVLGAAAVALPLVGWQVWKSRSPEAPAAVAVVTPANPTPVAPTPVAPTPVAPTPPPPEVAAAVPADPLPADLTNDPSNAPPTELENPGQRAVPTTTVTGTSTISSAIQPSHMPSHAELRMQAMPTPAPLEPTKAPANPAVPTESAPAPTPTAVPAPTVHAEDLGKQVSTDLDFAEIDSLYETVASPITGIVESIAASGWVDKSTPVATVTSENKVPTSAEIKTARWLDRRVAELEKLAMQDPSYVNILASARNDLAESQRAVEPGKYMVRAWQSGDFISHSKAGEPVTKGQALGVVRDASQVLFWASKPKNLTHVTRCEVVRGDEVVSKSCRPIVKADSVDGTAFVVPGVGRPFKGYKLRVWWSDKAR